MEQSDAWAQTSLGCEQETKEPKATKKEKDHRGVGRVATIFKSLLTEVFLLLCQGPGMKTGTIRVAADFKFNLVFLSFSLETSCLFNQ